MKTLELKDICGYLPYGLNVKEGENVRLVVGIYGKSYDFEQGYSSPENGDIDKSKSILRPMSDLIKEITHKGYNDGLPFVPYKELELKFPRFRFCPCTDAGEAVVKYLNIEAWDSSFDHGIEEYADIIDLLNLLMFDYRGLIDSGLAIDVNTLPENPYEQ